MTINTEIGISLVCLDGSQPACNTIVSGQFTSIMVSDMDNIYYISEDDPILLVDEIGMVEDGYEAWGMDDSRLPDLGDWDGERRIEYRHDKRYQLNEDAFAVIRQMPAEPLKINGKSMGSIASAVFNAKPAKLGKIDNISMGGLMFHHVDSKTQLSRALVLDILLADSGFYLANIAFKIITDVVIPEEFPGDSIKMRQVRLQFQKLNAIQQARLKGLIMNHGTDFERRMTNDE